MRNVITPGTEGLLQGFTKALYDVGGRDFSVVRNDVPGGYDAHVSVSFGPARLILDVNIALVPPRTRIDVDRRQSATPGTADVLVAPFLSAPVRDEIAGAGSSYWDWTGNMLIQSREPTVWIDRVGASRNPDPELSAGVQRLRSLKGRAASEVIVELLSSGGTASVRQLSRDTGTGVGTVSRVIDLLRSEELLDSGAAGIHIPDRLALARRWAQDYGFEKSFKPMRYISLLGEEVAMDRLNRSPLRFAVTGSRAAAAEFSRRSLVAPLPPTGAWLYTDDVKSVERELDLSPDSRGTVFIAECDFLVEGREGAQEGVPPLARAWRIVGDLMSGHGRLSALGDELAALLARKDTIE